MCNPRPAPETGRDDSGKAFPSDSQVEARLSYPYLSCQLRSLYWHLCSVPLPGRFGSLFCSPWHHSYIHRAIHISSISPLHLGKTQHRELCQAFLRFFTALKHPLSMPCQKIPLPIMIFLPQSSLTGDFGLLLPSPALPSELLALTNSPLATIAAAGSLPVCGHGYWGVKRSAHLSQKCSAALLTALTKSQAAEEWCSALRTSSDVRIAGPNAAISQIIIAIFHF